MRKLLRFYVYIKPCLPQLIAAIIFGALFGACSGFGMPVIFDKVLRQIFMDQGARAAPDVAHNRGRAAAADGVCAQGDIRVFERLPHDLFVAGSPAEAQTAHIRQNPKLPRGVFRQVHHGRPAHEADKRHRERPDCATVVLLRNLPPAPASARRPRLPALPLLHKGAGCDALHIFRGGAVLYSARTDDTQKHEAVCGQSADGP